LVATGSVIPIHMVAGRIVSLDVKAVMVGLKHEQLHNIKVKNVPRLKFTNRVVISYNVL